MFAWLLRILLAGLVSMLTLQDVFLDSSWQGTFKGAIIDLFTSHCSVREFTLLTWTREGMLSRLMRATEIRLRDIPTACFSDELNWPEGVPFCICLHKCKACCDLEYMYLSKCTPALTRPGLYPTESISTFLYFTFEWLVLLSCLHSGITNLSLKEGLSQTTSYGSIIHALKWCIIPFQVCWCIYWAHEVVSYFPISWLYWFFPLVFSSLSADHSIFTRWVS